MNQMKKRGLILVLLLFIVAAYAEECPERTIQIPDYFELDEGIFFSTDLAPALSYTWAPIDSSMRSFRIANNSISFTPARHDRGNHKLLIIGSDPDYCVYTKLISINVIGRPDFEYVSSTKYKIREGEYIRFNISVGNEPVSYEWYVDDVMQSDRQVYFYKANYHDQGNHTVSVVATNEYGLSSTFVWEVEVENVNRPPVLVHGLPNSAVLPLKEVRYKLEDYFYDADDDTLKYSYELTENETYDVEFANGSAIIRSLITVPQEVKILFFVTDGEATVKTNWFTIYNAVIDYVPRESENCVPQAECLEWETCYPANLQVRRCKDLNNCSVDEYIDSRRCEFNATCSDGRKNQDEEDVDCGGQCDPCPTCYDGIRNRDETGTDCGGLCPACPTCDDGIQNQGEIDVDCGGPCRKCSTGMHCLRNENCLSGNCFKLTCIDPSCNDKIMNQDELGIDCGGSCVPCPSCVDGIQNQDEIQIDCGGVCRPCPSCRDGILNQNEIYTDCGGQCSTCTKLMLREYWLGFLGLGILFFGLLILLFYKFNVKADALGFYLRLTRIFSRIRNNEERVVAANMAIHKLNILRDQMSARDASEISGEYVEIMHSFYETCFELEDVFTRGFMIKKIDTAWLVRHVLMELFDEFMRETDEPSLFKAELGAKIGRAIYALNEIKMYL